MLKSSLKKAECTKLLDGYKVFATSNTLPKPPEIKGMYDISIVLFYESICVVYLFYFAEIVESAGGQYLKKMPITAEDQSFVISCPKDKSVCQNAIKNAVEIVTTEALLTGLLRQKLELENHRIF